jgi:hypothetical protein
VDDNKGDRTAYPCGFGYLSIYLSFFYDFFFVLLFYFILFFFLLGSWPTCATIEQGVYSGDYVNTAVSVVKGHIMNQVFLYFLLFIFLYFFFFLFLIYIYVIIVKKYIYIDLGIIHTFYCTHSINGGINRTVCYIICLLFIFIYFFYFFFFCYICICILLFYFVYFIIMVRLIIFLITSPQLCFLLVTDLV